MEPNIKTRFKKEYFAHIAYRKNQFYTQLNAEHEEGVAALSEGFASIFGSSLWGRLVGLLHDIGKYSPTFQERIGIKSGYIISDKPAPHYQHSIIGAIYAREHYGELWSILGYPIAGHHAGLPDFDDSPYGRGLISAIKENLAAYKEIELLLSLEDKVSFGLTLPDSIRFSSSNFHLWIRMLYSCLVDADWLDTERFMQPERAALRRECADLVSLKPIFDAYMLALSSKARPSELNSIRASVLSQCLTKGKLPPGFFSLTVPTGGGKTLASMAWGVQHAKTNNKRRIVIAIPFTTVTAQTAKVYRDIFGEENICEHHSNLTEENTNESQRLVSENWDAPIVVTTNVQLFESLFSNKPSRCRKLHNLANSIIILDEVQALPAEFLKPILHVLSELVGSYGVSVLFTTATQPAFKDTIGGTGLHAFQGIDSSAITEIVDDTEKLSQSLRRTEIKILDGVYSYGQIAERLKEHRQVLCVVNSRRACREIYMEMQNNRIAHENVIHLSRMMCSAHILKQIERIRILLKNGEPVCVISTQLIEAGIDLDFETVYREMAGLDSIAQAGGRCNREGKRPGLGKVFVFRTAQMPRSGYLRKAYQTFERMTKKERDWLSPSTIEVYFKQLYNDISDFDTNGICKSLEIDGSPKEGLKFKFATAAAKFKLIDNESRTIVVNYGDSTELTEKIRKDGLSQRLVRQLQQFTVSVYREDFTELLESGRVEPLARSFIYIQSPYYSDLYDPEVGLMLENRWIEEVQIV
ncbi:MAG: CRISPR-associated helicase Cas3' [Bacteroidales bacterium]|nr:CRISPR-associated helicase Cas3' [Bacteroidales bacterium]